MCSIYVYNVFTMCSIHVYNVQDHSNFLQLPYVIVKHVKINVLSYFFFNIAHIDYDKRNKYINTKKYEGSKKYIK